MTKETKKNNLNYQYQEKERANHSKSNRYKNNKAI